MMMMMMMMTMINAPINTN